MSRTDAKIILMGAVCLVLGGTGVATAAQIVKNSDKVDGIHAVKSTATKAQAKNRLVATNGNGKLDRKFLPKVGDSDLLDGLDSTDFLGATSKAADSDLLDGKDSTDFLEACDEGALWGRAVIAGSSVATGGSPSELSTAGVSNSFFCQGQNVLARKTSAGMYNVVFGHIISANSIGKSGPPPMVTPRSTGVVASASGPFQCAPGSPPVLYEVCYLVRTTNLTGTAIDANFTITVQ